MRSILSATALLSVVALASAQPPPGCSSVRNDNPVLELPAVPLKNVTNGQSWMMQQGNNVVYIAKIKGSAYEMGYAFGQLYGQEIQKNMENMLEYGKSKIEELGEKFGIPDVTSDTVWEDIEPVLFELLDLNYEIAEPFIPQRYVDELQGIVDGSNGVVNHSLLIRVNMLPELIQAACTIVGSWGEASIDGKLYHLRALDWEPTAQVNQFPSVVIYESTEPGSKPFANIGYLGLVGSLTAISKIGISVGEKVMYAKPGDYPVMPNVTYFGKPWMFVLRDTVQFANNIVDVQTLIENTNRTMMIHLGWGSLPDNTFHGMSYASNMLYYYDDKNYTHYTDVHPQMNGIFFQDKYIQPSDSKCLGNILMAAHGNISAETLYRDVAGYHSTGNAQVIVMDPEGQQIWASWSQYGAPVNAFERSPIHIRLSDFWGSNEESQAFLD